MITSLSEPLWRRAGTAFFVNGATFGVWATQIPLLKQRLGLDPGQLGLMLLCVGIGAVLAMSASGLLLARFGSAALVRWSAVGFCALLPCIATVTSIPLEAFLIAGFGACGGTMDVSMNAYGSTVEQRAGRPQMSSYHGMFSFGGLAGAGLGGVLLGWLGGPYQALIAGMALLALAVAMRPTDLPSASTAAPAKRRGGLDLSRTALLLGVMMALSFSTEGVILDWGALYLATDLHAAPDMASSAFAAFSGAMALVRFVGDPIRARIGGATLVRGGAGLALIGVALGPLTGVQSLAVLGYALAGVGLSNIVPVFFSAAGRLPHSEAAIATLSIFGYAGLLAAPPTLGFLAQHTSIGAVFGGAAVMCLVVMVGAGLAAER